MKNKGVVMRHVIVWLIYISYELSLIQITVGLNGSIFHYAIYYLLNVCLFYFNAHVVLDFSFFKSNRPYIIASFLIFIEIVGFLFFKLLVDTLLAGTNNFVLIFNLSNEKLWLTNIFREIFFIGFSIAYWSMLYMVRFKEKNHMMEKEKLKSIAENLELENKYIVAENAYLQNQISPHLLFNSLNFIYNAVHNLSDRAGKGVMLLADIMRYSLVSSEDNRTVPLKKELEQIEKLIELSQLRFKGEFFVRFRKKGRLSDVEILPLTLITLVENMIKHGDLGEARHPALVTLEYQENILVFKTTNKKRKGSPYPKSGLGLKNIEKRLINHYQERFKLEILDNDDDFSVTLILHL